MFEYVFPYGKINYPLIRVHRCRIPKANIFNLEGILKYQKIYKILCKDNYIIVNPRICEIPLVFYMLGKYKKSPGCTVLDIGCCESPVSVMLSALGYKVYAVDLNDYELSTLYNNITFIKEDIIKCDFRDKPFDVILAISTIEHIDVGSGYGENYHLGKDKIVIKKIYNWLKDDDIFIMSVPMEKDFRIVPNFEKHYDFRSIYALLKDFKILEEIYLKKEGNWKIVSKDDVINSNDVFVGFYVVKRRG